MLYNNILHDDALVVQLTVSQIKAIIRDVLQESPLYLTSEKSETLTIEEVSELTGYKKATLYKLTHERKIPFHKPAHGGRRIFLNGQKSINGQNLIILKPMKSLLRM